MVINDLRKKITSPWTAANVYHVAFDEETLEIDRIETGKLRQQERERRKRQGKPYNELIKEWLERKPGDQIIRSYGPWPEGIK